MGLNSKDLASAPWSGCYFDEKSDDTDYENVGRGFIVLGTAGAVKVLTLDGEEKTFTTVPAGVLVPLLVRRLYATGTAATYIVVGY